MILCYIYLNLKHAVDIFQEIEYKTLRFRTGRNVNRYSSLIPSLNIFIVENLNIHKSREAEILSSLPTVTDILRILSVVLPSHSPPCLLPMPPPPRYSFFFVCFLVVLCGLLVGSQFPDQGLNSSPQQKVWNPNHWTARDIPTPQPLQY